MKIDAHTYRCRIVNKRHILREIETLNYFNTIIRRSTQCTLYCVPLL